MNVLTVLILVIQTMEYVTTMMVAMNVTVKLVGLPLVESPTPSALISMNVRSPAFTIVMQTQDVTTTMVLSHALASMVSLGTVLMATVSKILSNLLTNALMEHMTVTSPLPLARILMPDTSATVKIVTCPLTLPILVYSTSTHVTAKLI